MFEANLKIIDELKQFVSLLMNNTEVLEKFSISSTDFSRKRKLSFDRLVLFIAKLCKKTLSVELENFFEQLNLKMDCSVSAFTQQRMKLHPNFFKAWNDVLLLSHSFYYSQSIKRWNKYRLVAGDGSNISLVKTEGLQGHFGGQSNQQCSFVQAKTFYCYDVLNELILSAQIEPYRTGELTMAYSVIEELKEDMLMIYDRNFFNYKMMALHLWNRPEIKFVIRAKESNKIVRSFIESNAESALISIPATPSAISGLKKSGFEITKDTTIQIRLIRVELENSIEVLATNLWQEEDYCPRIFKDLYFKRWGIETNIKLQKNLLQLETFSGLTVQSVKQDFFATIFLANLHSILITDAQQLLNEKVIGRKYPVKINRNKSQGKLRNMLVQLFFIKDPEFLMKELIEYFIRDPIIVRKNRTFPRIVKNKQSKSKHKTYMNFKLAC
jgi:hypothetical protein